SDREDQNTVADLCREHPEAHISGACRSERTSDDVAPVFGRGRPDANLARVYELMHDGVIDANLLELTVGEPVRLRVTDIEAQPVAHPIDGGEHDAAECGSCSSSRRDGERLHCLARTAEDVQHVIQIEALAPDEGGELRDHFSARALPRFVP